LGLDLALAADAHQVGDVITSARMKRGPGRVDTVGRSNAVPCRKSHVRTSLSPAVKRHLPEISAACGSGGRVGGHEIHLPLELRRSAGSSSTAPTPVRAGTAITGISASKGP